MSQNPIPTTDRLIFRRWRDSDREPFARMNADPRVMTGCGVLGQGLATEGARAAVWYGFEMLGLKEIVSFTVPGNARSTRVMEKLGMTRNPADDFEHPRLPEGHPLRRHVLYRLRRADWEYATAVQE